MMKCCKKEVGCWKNPTLRGKERWGTTSDKIKKFKNVRELGKQRRSMEGTAELCRINHKNRNGKKRGEPKKDQARKRVQGNSKGMVQRKWQLRGNEFIQWG